ncbi:hypothetical protein F4556_001168 [Kitasatospora gansuensis]|uniref:Transposase n=1 Tax=Kitasatospora gansuensis TaxID=258050 RepID=A0A7W7S869_9ACTN|nr:hypothetical protein [Kitasatospora gansuensis]
MKVVAWVKLLPEAGQADALRATLRAVNECANWVSVVAFQRGVPREYELRKHTYAELKARGLGAQAAQHVIKKTRDAYTTLKVNIRVGNLGKPGSKRWIKAESKPVVFRPVAAQPYDDRCLSWQLDQQTVSIWTTGGRLKNVRFVCSADALKLLRDHRKGESDLTERDGVYHLDRVPGCRAWAEPAPQAATRPPKEAPGQGHQVRQTSAQEALPQGSPACRQREPHRLQDHRHHR